MNPYQKTTDCFHLPTYGFAKERLRSLGAAEKGEYEANEKERKKKYILGSRGYREFLGLISNQHLFLTTSSLLEKERQQDCNKQRGGYNLYLKY